MIILKPPGVTTDQAQKVVDQVAKDFPSIKAQNKAQYKDSQLAQFDQILGLMYVLLLLAVIIALIGILNTLALSIYERTREIGLLRAVGMTRKQTSRMVRGEALIVAVFGSLLGLAIGVVFGAAIVQALDSEGISLTLPVGQLHRVPRAGRDLRRARRAGCPRAAPRISTCCAPSTRSSARAAPP